MKNLAVFRTYIMTVLVIAASFNYAQDSSKIIILSNDVGLIVDSVERNEYKILPLFEDNFISAFFYMGSDNQYYCNVKLQSGNFVKDSVINLNYFSIRNTAVRIQNLESQKRGDKSFNIQNVELKFADSKEVKNLTYEQNKIKIENTNSQLPTNKLDLDYATIIGRDFEFGLSAGIVYNSATFDGLNKIFNLLEENIPEEPYNIPLSAYTFSASPLFRFSSIVIFKNSLIGEVEYSLSKRNNVYSNLDYKTFAISFSYVIPLLKNPYPFVTLGYSASKFTVVKNYNALVNDRQGRLESITLDGNAKGFNISLGLMYNLISEFGVSLYANYKFYPEINVNQQVFWQIQNLPKVDLKGIELGMSLYLRM